MNYAPVYHIIRHVDARTRVLSDVIAGTFATSHREALRQAIEDGSVAKPGSYLVEAGKTLLLTVEAPAPALVVVD